MCIYLINLLGSQFPIIGTTHASTQPPTPLGGSPDPTQDLTFYQVTFPHGCPPDHLLPCPTLGLQDREGEDGTGEDIGKEKKRKGGKGRGENEEGPLFEFFQ